MKVPWIFAKKIFIGLSIKSKFFLIFALSNQPQKIAKNYESIIHQRQSAKEWQHCKTFETGYGRRG